MIFPYVALAGAILLTGIGQVLLKKGAQNMNPAFWGKYLSSFTLAGYTMFLFVMVLSVYALQYISLKIFYALTSLNFILVLILSWIFLGEDINFRKLFAVLCIILGVVIFVVGLPQGIPL